MRVFCERILFGVREFWGFEAVAVLLCPFVPSLVSPPARPSVGCWQEGEAGRGTAVAVEDGGGRRDKGALPVFDDYGIARGRL